METSKFKYCPNCDHMMYQGQRFCPQCHFDTQADKVIGHSSITVKSFIKHTQNTTDYEIVKTPFVNCFVAIRLFFARSFDFTGRSNRSEFWWWWLVNTVVNILFYVGVMHQTFPVLLQPINGYVSTGMELFAGSQNVLTQISLWWFIYLLATLMGDLSLLVRRLRDVGLSKLIIMGFLIGGLIPFVNILVVIVTVCFLIMPSMRVKSTTNNQKHDE